MGLYEPPARNSLPEFAHEGHDCSTENIFTKQEVVV